MRYAKEHKGQTRARIVDTAGRMFRRHGIAGSGVAAMMSEAELTAGALYAHFPSRDALIAQVLDEAITKTKADVIELIAAARHEGEPLLGRVIEVYLSERHLDSVEMSCALASLGSEIRHQPEEARAIADQRFHETVEAIAAALPAAERYKAGPLFGMLAATLQMAWLASSRAEQLERLENGKHAARSLIGTS